MPLPNTFTTFTNGATITAADINSRVVDLETFINGDITSADLPNDKWVSSSIVVDPAFYGSPAPRVEMVSSDVHYRKEGGATNSLFYNYNVTNSFIPLPGLSATIHVAIPDGFPSETVQACIRASFYSENENSVSGSTLSANTNLLVVDTAIFALFVDGTELEATRRKVYCECDAEDKMAGQNVSMVSLVGLSRGLHNISVRILPSQPGAAANFQHTVIRHRTLNIELYYL